MYTRLNQNHTLKNVRENGTHTTYLKDNRIKSVVQKKEPIQNSNAPIQRRVQVGGYTVVTTQNKDQIGPYAFNKQKYDQAEENKYAKRQNIEPKKIQALKGLHIADLLKPLYNYYVEFSPPCKFAEIVHLLTDWANTIAPSEVVPDKDGIIPLVSTQDNAFKNVKDLFFALVQNIRSQSNIAVSEKASFDILGNIGYYEKSILHMLILIEGEMRSLMPNARKAILTAGYAKNLIDPKKLDQTIYLTVNQEKNALLKLFIGINTIHSFIIATNKIAKGHRKVISSKMGDRTNKYSPFGPEIESARRRGIAVWSSFSGSTADILYLAQLYGLRPESIHKLASLTAAFFQFMPTSLNPTHTFHEVMFVANKLFGVPYDATNPMAFLPHNSLGTLPMQIQPKTPRVGTYESGVEERPTDSLISLHDVPRKGVPMTNITDIRDVIKQKGYNLKYPISTTVLPNSDMLVTGGHHRIAAMKLLGQESAPVKIYNAKNTEKIKLAKMIGIARITGKYYHEWNPQLNPMELKEVNTYLTKWKEANDDQVKYDFLFQDNGMLHSKL